MINPLTHHHSILIPKFWKADSELRILNCNLEFCQKVGYKKSILVDSRLKKIVPKHSLKFYSHFKRRSNQYEVIQGSTRNNQHIESNRSTAPLFGSYRKKIAKQSHHSQKFSHQINLIKSNGSLEFFSAQIKVCKVTDLESFLLVKLVPNFSGKIEGKSKETSSSTETGGL